MRKVLKTTYTIVTSALAAAFIACLALSAGA
jgi:hypothetical protein